MIANRFQSLFADPYGAPVLIRRLLADHALRHRRLYVTAFLLMGVAAACTALSAYLLGNVVNQAYVHKNFHALLVVGIAAFVIFALKGAATYGQQVIMMRIGNRIVADNQRRMFDKLLTENIGFFSDRHSSEFIARLTTGSTAVNLVLTLLITSIGRDFFTLIGLFAVMVIQDPVMSLAGLVIAPPAMIALRKLMRRVRAIAKTAFTGGTQTIETLQETLQGLRVVKAFTLEEEMRRRFDTSVSAVQHEADKWARVANRASPPSVSIRGLARLATRAHLSPSCCTAETLASKRRRISSSSVNAFTTRKPCSVSCNVSIVCVPPVNCTLMMARTRRTSLRRNSIAGGAMISPTNAITGSWTIITANRPISVNTSRPRDVISSESARFAAVEPVVSRAMNSEEWRSEKKPMFSVSSLSNMRRWLSATIRLPIRIMMTCCPYVAAPLSAKIPNAASPTSSNAWKFLCT